MSEVIRFRCPAGHRLKTARRSAGKQVHCPYLGCGKVAVVPQPRSPVRGTRPEHSEPSFPLSGWWGSSLLVVAPETNPPASYSGSFLLQSSLRQWELDALNAFHFAIEVRGALRLMGLVLMLNVLARVMFFEVYQKIVGAQLAAVEFAGFLVFGVLLGITYARPSFGWLLATALACLVLAFGCVTFLFACALFAALPESRRFPYHHYLSGDRFRVIKARLEYLLDTPRPVNWWPCWNRGSRRNATIRLRLFENAGLLLLHRNGSAVFLDRADALNFGLRRVASGEYELVGLAPAGPLTISKDFAREWRTWGKGR